MDKITAKIFGHYTGDFMPAKVQIVSSSGVYVSVNNPLDTEHANHLNSLQGE